jgi:hypothetical protein
MDILKSITFTPEWVQALAAVFGVIGLLTTILIQIRTVRIQARTSELQAEQIYREKNVQRIKMMPLFSLEVIPADEDVGNNQIVLTLTDNPVDMFMVEAATNVPIKLNFNIDFTTAEKPGKKFRYTFNWINNGLDFNRYKIVQLEYMDQLGNFYNQTIEMMGRQITITPPMLNLQYQIDYLNRKKWFNRFKSIFKKQQQRMSIFPPEKINSI